MSGALLTSLLDQTPPLDRREAVLSYLIDNNLVDKLSIGRARTVAERARQPLEVTLNQMGAVSDQAITKAYAEITGFRVWDPAELTPFEGLGDLEIATDYLRDNRLLPLGLTETQIVVAACDPLNEEVLAGLGFAADRAVEVLIASPSDWRRAFAEIYGGGAQTAAPDERRVELDLQFVADSGAESDSARLVAAVFDAALAKGASDIHFEPRRHDLRVRLRIDGRLVDVESASSDLSAPVTSRVKVLANLDLGERRLPQDGRATFVAGGRPIDVRISTLPSAFGETAVLRILDRKGAGFDFAELGFGDRDQALLDQVARTPHGIFLVTGPTGSGKTTTLYALLNSMAGAEKKILSVEDPIEYHFQHVVQVQASPAIGLTFASVLRSFLRQDPDIILVGEIRDAETAQVAIQAAMTGHLVLASLHANDAVKVVPRLLDMGLEPYQLAAALIGSLAQRLVRRLCPHCRVAREPNSAEAAFSAASGHPRPKRIFDPVGCTNCEGSGYRGRIALVEGLVFDERMAGAIAGRQPMAALMELAGQQGFRPMLADGLSKAELGLTTLREVMASAGA